MSKVTVAIIIILLMGILYRLLLTADGNFIFNMDNARDMVDMREMIELKKPRLIGPTSAIEGLFNGPGWYYLLSLPFIVSNGDPYASIILEIGLWAIGGFFLLKLVSKWGSWLVLPVGFIWVVSDYIVLATRYAFNPNPIIFLTPVFLYLLVEYLKQGKAIYGILAWFLAGLFFNFEMNFGVFTPIIIVVSIILTKNIKFLKQRWFWFGVSLFIFTLLPQILFDLKHDFIMSKAVLRHLSENSSGSLNFLIRFQSISASFYNTFSATLMNHKLFTTVILVFLIPMIVKFWKEKKKDSLVTVSFVLIAIPFLGYLMLTVNINPWHLGTEMIAFLILIAYLLKNLLDGNLFSKIASIMLSVLIVWFTILNISNFFIKEWGKPNLDPSLFKNEIAAIDYVYQKAGGQNFKVYVYLPSVYDYPYQYLFWWYGKKKYGYIPGEYAYASGKPQYIPSQDKFQGRKDNFSGLVFLIKEPDRNDTRSGWEGNFVKLKRLNQQMVGPLEIEIRRQ